jgi:hypothetical protein
MEDVKVYRWTGVSALAAIAVFFIEFPFYFAARSISLRGGPSSWAITPPGMQPTS